MSDEPGTEASDAPSAVGVEAIMDIHTPRPLHGPSNSTISRPLYQNVLLLTGTSGVLFICGFICLGVLAPGYDAARSTISSLESTSMAMGQRVNFIAYGVLLACFGVGLHRELVGGRAAVLAPAFQVIAGVAVIGDGIFIHAPLHHICDLFAFNSTLIVLFLFAWRFWGDANWKGWSAYSILTAILMMGSLTAFGVANSRGGPAGAFEKLAVAIRVCWSLLLVARLMRGRRLWPLAYASA